MSAAPYDVQQASAANDTAGGTSIVTEPANRVRAVARVAATPQPPAGVPEMRPTKRSGQLGPVHILQLLVVEALVVGVLALLGKGPVTILVAGALAGVLCVATLARRRGRWWLEQWAMTRLYRRRRTASRPVAVPRDQLAGLQLLAPGLTVTELGGPPAEPDTGDTAIITPRGRDGARPAGADAAGVIAVARDPAGWYAVAEITPEAAMADHPGAAVPLPMLARTLAATGQAGVLLQIVTQGSPAPAAAVHPTAPAARSYRDLLAEVGSGPAPVDRVRWLVVRLEARLLAVAGAAGKVGDRAPAVVAALLRRAVRTLERVGLTANPLDGPGLLAAVHQGCGLENGPDAPREEWSAWHSGQLTHISYWISDWPPPAQVPALLRALAEVPAAQTTIAMTIVVPPADLDEDVLDAPLGEAGLRCLVRVTAPSERLAEVHAAVLRCARDCAARVHRLDGEHAPAVYATAPTGGGPW